MTDAAFVSSARIDHRTAATVSQVDDGAPGEPFPGRRPTAPVLDAPPLAAPPPMV